MNYSIPDIYEIMQQVGRVHFLPKDLQYLANLDEALPIGHDQTISQPYVVAFMTSILSPEKTDKILEIGTGSGFQAAVLSRMVDKVYSIEIIKPLAEEATARLNRLGYNNIYIQHGDGYWGWNEHAPYDCIIVTACAEIIPPPLLKQLKPGGRMIIPIGPEHGLQHLVLVQKDEEENIISRKVLAVRFVPFTRS